MGFFDTIKKGSFVTAFMATKELFNSFVDDYVTMKAKAKILKNKESQKEKQVLLENEVESMKKTLLEVKAWCEKAIKTIEEVTK